MSVHSNLFITLETFALLLISQKGGQLIARWHLLQLCFVQQSMNCLKIVPILQLLMWQLEDPKERPGRGIPTNLWSCLLSLLLPLGHPEASWAQKSRFLRFQDFLDFFRIFWEFLGFLGIPTNLWSCLLSLLLPPAHPEASWAQQSRFI